MENFLSNPGAYWPYFLGLIFLAVIAFNFRTWLLGRKEGD